MSFKTIIIITLSVLITVIFMQNTDQVLFTLLWKQVYVSKLWMMLIVTFFGFIIGLIVAWPKKKKAYDADKNIPLEVQNTNDEAYLSTNKTQDLSDEDKDYIN
ncbi:MAG: hypothetical protein IE931_04315 [Sphingobacteriales bacterium]|nr:hypothetical protein [Sphingobacteriales bacterium]